MRGDDPTWNVRVDVAAQEFPACAGMIRRELPGRVTPGTGVPRMRGDDPLDLGDVIVTSSGGVPRMRGDDPYPCIRDLR